MPFIVGNLDSLLYTGPLVAVKLCAPETAQSDALPIDALAEINTGSIVTIIQEGIATSLGLKFIGKQHMSIPLRPVYEADTYLLRIQFAEDYAIETRAIEMPYMFRTHVRIKCLIGRDVLKLAVFTYNGLTNTFSLKF
jgi:hypothetical protein